MVINRQRRVRVAVRPLDEFLDRVRCGVGFQQHDFTVCLVSDAAIARLNRAFRGKRGPTDVLSFPANGMPPNQPSREAGKQRLRLTAAAQAGGPLRRRQAMDSSPSLTSSTSFTSCSSYLGDIAISPEAALRNARRFARTLSQELRVLILHGVLHLAGYDHEADRGEMDRLERRLRRRLGLS